MGGDGDDVHVYYGTALISEEELNPRKRKSAVDQGQARQVAPWNQEVSISHGGLIEIVFSEELFCSKDWFRV